MTTDAAPSTLASKLRDGRFVMTAEITPPVSCSAADMLDKALPLRGFADAVNVTDGASAMSMMSSLAASALLAQNGLEPIMQFTCRDRNRIAIQADLMGAGALGVRNFLMLHGDDPKAGDQPETKAVFDTTSNGLMETARRMRDAGELPSGRKVAHPAAFFIGAADAPFDPPPGWKPDKLKAKADAGAEFLQTQFCMDAGIVRRYMARLSDEGLTQRLSVLIGIAPLRAAKSARWMRDNLYGTIITDEQIARLEGAADPVAEGKKIAAELIAEFATIPGVSGVHIMAPRNEHSVPEVIAEARKSVQFAAKK